MKRAVIVGKFHPPHAGHSFLINTALNECDEVHVLVCDHEKYHIPAKKRAQWISEMHSGAVVRVIPDIGKDDDSDAWAKHTCDFLGFTPNVVYTSESYGQPWADALGCEHRCVDIKREIVPISATRIREQPETHLSFLSPRLKANYTRRVVILGAESTGTTTLAKMLAKKLCCPWTVELGRYYSISLMSSQSYEWRDEDFEAIARLQQNYEDAVATHSDGIIVCDTNAFATMLWQQRYMGHTTAAVRELATAAPADLYVLTSDDIPFVQDGIRDGEHIRHQMHADFETALQALDVPHIVVTGTKKQRLSQALNAIAQLPSKKIPLYKEYSHETKRI